MKVTLSFTEPGYIEEPYWKEQNERIDIRKKSGVDAPRLGDAKRRERLESYLRSLSMTLKDFEELERKAAKPFHTFDGTPEIVIPAVKIANCIVNACAVLPSRLRIASPRTALQIPRDFRTGIDKPTGIWGRFVKGEQSNQRRWQESSYISNFKAAGEIDFEPDLVKPTVLIELLREAGLKVGIGACRKMGYGRFTVETS